MEADASAIDRQVHFKHQLSQLVILSTAQRSRRLAGKIVEREQTNQDAVPVNYRNAPRVGAAASAEPLNRDRLQLRNTRAFGPWLLRPANPSAACPGYKRPYRRPGRSESRPVCLGHRLPELPRKDSSHIICAALLSESCGPQILTSRFMICSTFIVFLLPAQERFPLLVVRAGSVCDLASRLRPRACSELDGICRAATAEASAHFL